MGLFKKLQDSRQHVGDAVDRPDAVGRASSGPWASTPPTSAARRTPRWPTTIPIFAPIEGIDLATYARLAKIAQGQGVTDEAGMAAVAQAEGIDPAAWTAASKGWIERMGQNMAVGQKFRQHLDAS